MYTEKLQKVYEDFLRDFVEIVKKLDENVLRKMKKENEGIWTELDRKQIKEYEHRYGERLNDEIFYIFYPLYEDGEDSRFEVNLGFNLTADGRLEPLLIEKEIGTDPQITDISRLEALPKVELYPEILYNLAKILDKFVKYVGSN
jgi:hypothetical protein